jgi:hypothetical protein
MNMCQDLIPNDGDRIICVKVGKVLRENLYEMTRKMLVPTTIFAILNRERKVIVMTKVEKCYSFIENSQESWGLLIHFTRVIRRHNVCINKQ